MENSAEVNNGSSFKALSLHLCAMTHENTEKPQNILEFWRVLNSETSVTQSRNNKFSTVVFLIKKLRN
jgi:hypothetical protein